MHVTRCFCFFQAEDGIRDLVRSRGLGDVYKRQEQIGEIFNHPLGFLGIGTDQARDHVHAVEQEMRSVSYTHLTLPTSDLV